MNEARDINTLSRETGISVRTIRYYLAQDLLPPPAGRGPAATYGSGHRDRLTLIRRLQDAHLPLAEIRKQLQALDDAGVVRALAGAVAGAEPPALNAYDYVRQVLAKRQSPDQGLTDAGPESLSGPAGSQKPAVAAAAPGAPAPVALPAAADPRKPTRSHWERIALHPDIELHVRRPLARPDQRRLDELLDQAQRLFGGDCGAPGERTP